MTVEEEFSARHWPLWIAQGVDIDLDGADDTLRQEVVPAVINNVCQSDFRWTGSYAGSLLGGAMEGDCHVLSEGVVEILQTLRLGSTDMGTESAPFMVLDSQVGMIGDTPPSVQGRGNTWVIENHYWVCYGGQGYDIRSTRRGAPVHRPTGERPQHEHDGQAPGPSALG
ncbi:hypothetical protein ACFCXT_23220 [Streptomyces vinaceus]|uniref:hypothetical protein n=1 Tax=Streptomyces vinaceus TaxID=1960 RepID=UPI0035E20F6D